MKPLTVSLMMMWCLVGILQVLNPNPFVIFIDIIMIIMSIYFMNAMNDGWVESNKLNRDVLDFTSSIIKKKGIKK